MLALAARDYCRENPSSLTCAARPSGASRVPRAPRVRPAASVYSLMDNATIRSDSLASTCCPTDDVEPPFPKYTELTAEAQAARLLYCRQHTVTLVRHLAAAMGLPIERAELLMYRGLSTLLARGYPAEELCATYHLTPVQLSQAAIVPAFSSMFEPLPAPR